MFQGSTRFDYTNYFKALPVNALERAIWLEADRKRSLDVSAENLKHQQNVVSEEVRVNADNFYGDLSELEAATLEDVRSFFKTYYAPNNAVLVVVGDTTAAEVRRLAEKHFGSIPNQPLPGQQLGHEGPDALHDAGRLPERQDCCSSTGGD